MQKSSGFFSGSTNEEKMYFRASEGDSFFFFCKILSASSLHAQWLWTPHNSSPPVKLYMGTQHFHQRIQVRNKENDFSLKISPVKWSDSGKYNCSRSSDMLGVFELVMVRGTRHCLLYNPHKTVFMSDIPICSVPENQWSLCLCVTCTALCERLSHRYALMLTLSIILSVNFYIYFMTSAVKHVRFLGKTLATGEVLQKQVHMSGNTVIYK